MRRTAPSARGGVRRWPAVMAGGLAVLAIIAFILWRVWTGWTPDREQYPIQGISVSARNGEIQWDSIAAQNVDFAYIRATQGDGHRDPQFARNWTEARRAGLRYGAELVYDLCRLASDQATMFMTTVPRDNAALPPVVRLGFDGQCADRPSRDTILSELNTLLNMIELHAGKPAILRTSPDFEAAYDVGSGVNRTLWLEGNLFPPDYASRPWVMWTASDARRLRGSEGPVDWNVVAQ